MAEQESASVAELTGPAIDDVMAAATTSAPPATSDDEIDRLALMLLDLESGYEAALRTALSIHRLLERVRRCGAMSGEGTLLVQEMARKVVALGDGTSPLRKTLDDAAMHLAALSRAA